MQRDSRTYRGDDRIFARRRKILQAAGLAGVGGLAGCFGGDDGDETPGDEDTPTDDESPGGEDTSTDQSGSGEPVDSEFTLGSMWIPGNDLQWNEFSFANYIWMIQAVVMDPLGVWDPVENEFVGLLADDWSFDESGPALQMTINTDYNWHDGEEVVRPVTVDDWYTHFQLEVDMGWSTSEYVDEITIEDDETITFHYHDHMEGERTALWEQMDNPLSHGMTEEVYGEYVERFEDATSDDERDTISSDLSELAIPTEEVVTYGPFALSEATTEKLTAVKNEGHPAADDINFSSIGWPLLQDEQSVWQALSSGQIDGHVRFSIPDDVALQFPDEVEFTTYRSYGGFALAFNQEGEQVGDPQVRRALGFVIDKEEVIRNVGATTREQVTYNTGIPPGEEDRFIDPSQFTEYGVDHDRATQLLEDAGLSNDDGQWYQSNGDPFAPDVKTGSTGGPDLIAAQTVVNQLQRFGIQSSLQSMEGTAFESSVWETSDFEIAGHGWGAAYPEPFAMYNNPFRWNRENVNLPETIELPPVGDHDGEPGAISFHSEDTLQDLVGAAGDELGELTTNYAWAHEYLTPWFQVFENYEQTWFTDDDWVYPDLDSDIMQRRFYSPLHYILKTGEFKARTE